MPPAVETLAPADPTPNENGAPKPVVGIIYPPPEVRSKLHAVIITFV